MRPLQPLLPVLRWQARWLARSLGPPLSPRRFPYPATLSLCLPAFNEQQNITATLDCALTILPRFVARLEIIVVDDGSSDGTAQLVAELAATDPRVRLLRHGVNRGYGAAVTSGLRAARGDLLMFADSDGQFNFLDVARLLVAIGDDDLVIGYRRRRADHARRRFNAWLWGRLVHLILGVNVRDLDCAFKLFRRETLERLRLTSRGACINAEIMAQCVWGGLRFKEIPVAHFPRLAGVQTGAHWRVIARALGELPSLRRYRRQPLLARPAPAGRKAA
jgi:glycosyltransferase involved in cell wall biosynthesis